MINSNTAIFLDRDGVINKEKDDYVKSVDELEIFPYVGAKSVVYQNSEKMRIEIPPFCL